MLNKLCKTNEEGNILLEFYNKKQDDNPLHTEYGIISNSIYILGKMKQYYPLLLFYIFIGTIAGSLMQYLWSFIGKFVIDIVQA